MSNFKPHFQSARLSPPVRTKTFTEIAREGGAHVGLGFGFDTGSISIAGPAADSVKALVGQLLDSAGASPPSLPDFASMASSKLNELYAQVQALSVGDLMKSGEEQGKAAALAFALQQLANIKKSLGG